MKAFYPTPGIFEFSNFQPFEIKDGIYTFPTIEHWYQSQKTDDKQLKKTLSEAVSPGIAKKMGSRIPKHLMKSNWMDIRLIVMRSAIDLKFYQGTEYHEQLMQVYYPLVEYNTWHDNFWGSCTCKLCKNKEHQNNLGKILDSVRLRWQYYYFK